MDASIVASSFLLLFLAEMGDKTQLMAMTLARRYRPLPVALGTCAAFLVLDLVAVLAGDLLLRFVPQRALLGIAGLLFLTFAWNSWRTAINGDGSAADTGSTHGALVTSFLLIFVAELGDKTQIALLTLVASTGAPWSVFAGGTLALWSVSLLGVFVGATLLARVPALWVHRGAAALFAVFGLLALARVLND